MRHQSVCSSGVVRSRVSSSALKVLPIQKQTVVAFYLNNAVLIVIIIVVVTCLGDSEKA